MQKNRNIKAIDAIATIETIESTAATVATVALATTVPSPLFILPSKFSTYEKLSALGIFPFIFMITFGLRKI